MHRVAKLFVALTAVAALLVALTFRQPEDESGREAARLNNLGVAYMNQQRLEQALELFQRAYDLDPELYTARLNLGIVLLNSQRYEEGREILLEATQQEPSSPRAWYNLGLLDRNSGQAEQALDAFQRVAQLDPGDADTHYLLGAVYTQLQRYEAAIAAYQQALALNRFHVSAEFGLARAYQRMGESGQAQQHLARFRQLTEEQLGVPMGLVYGDQGPYSLAQQVTPELSEVPPAIRVRFVPVAAEAGLQFEHAGQLVVDDRATGDELNRQTLTGSGACFLDYDGDGRSDLFLVNSGQDAASALYRNAGNGRFIETTSAALLDVRGYGMACTAGDYDNDGWIDLAVSFFGRVALFRNEGDGTFSRVTQAPGIQTDGYLLGLTFLDYDHDGDLDLYVTSFVSLPQQQASSPTTNILWRNNGNGTFTDWTEATEVAVTADSVAAVGTDFNNDRAVDIVVTGQATVPALFANQREGPFLAVEPWATPIPAPTAGVAVLDFNKDGWMDQAFTHSGRPGFSLWRNVEGESFESVPLPGNEWINGWGIVALDYDNDGWVDWAAVGESAEGAQIRLLRNRGPAGFEDVTATVGLATVTLEHPRALITADYDGDGDTDLLVTQNGGPVQLLRNDGGNRNSWLRIALTGLADNKTAIGTKVEVFAGSVWQKWEVHAASGYLGQSSLEITAGLGSAPEADVVRLLWPTGVLQDEVHLDARTRHSLNEIDRRGSSCPILFAWNGSRYEFVTDVIGAGIVGHWVGPGQRNVSDPTEYVKVAGARVQPSQGRLSFRFLEPMEELIYLDQVRLLAVDHPTAAQVYPNEYFASSPPFPSFKVVVSREAHPPGGAWDDLGRDVRPELLHVDRDYVAGFGHLPFKGFAELHGLELDLGEQVNSQPLRLLLHGFIDYFSATSVFAAHQAGVQPIPPYVEALDAAGRWVRVVDNMGFPAGLARTMVADLTGRLPAGTRRIRIVTNLQIYWDQILIDTTAEDVPVRLAEVPLADATLDFRGYPRAVEGTPRGDLTYVYEEISQTGPYARHVGSYTRYGDVHALLSEVDDQFVILGSGEEVALEFDPTALPRVPPGWTRDYFFFADGFAKDMDFYAAHPQTVEPLPFHGMGHYPYPATARHPEDGVYLTYYLDYTTRQVSGNGVPTFRFRYGPEPNN